MSKAESRLLVRGLSGPITGRSWSVYTDRALLLGREVAEVPGMTAVSIPDPRVSSNHCRIEYASGSFRVVDLNSRNGILVNGRRIPRGASEELRDGDVLSLAELALEVRLTQGSEEGTPRPDSVVGPRTVVAGETGRTASPIVLELTPFPLAVAVRQVRHAITAQDTVQEILRSFEVILRFQTLVALSEYLTRESRDDQMTQLLTSFCQRPFTLGRWLELFFNLTRALAGDGQLVIEEFARWGEGEDVRRWRSNAARLVELRNSLLHGEGIHMASAETVAPEMTVLFNDILSSLVFWMGYRFISIEPGSWSDEEGAFRYPSRLLLGCATPFEVRMLKSPIPLPPRVPIVVSRDGKRRLSLGPLQALLPGEDKQLHWFWLGECSAGRSTFVTYPASFRTACPLEASLQKLLNGEASKARADFVGGLPFR